MAKNHRNWICRTQIKPADVKGTMLSILSAMDQLTKQYLHTDYSKQCSTALSSPHALTSSTKSSKQQAPTPQPEAAHTHSTDGSPSHTATSITPVKCLTPPHHPPNARKISVQRGVSQQSRGCSLFPRLSHVKAGHRPAQLFEEQ